MHFIWITLYLKSDQLEKYWYLKELILEKYWYLKEPILEKYWYLKVLTLESIDTWKVLIPEQYWYLKCFDTSEVLIRSLILEKYGYWKSTDILDNLKKKKDTLNTWNISIIFVLEKYWFFWYIKSIGTFYTLQILILEMY